MAGEDRRRIGSGSGTLESGLFTNVGQKRKLVSGLDDSGASPKAKLGQSL